MDNFQTMVETKLHDVDNKIQNIDNTIHHQSIQTAHSIDNMKSEVNQQMLEMKTDIISTKQSIQDLSTTIDKYSSVLDRLDKRLAITDEVNVSMEQRNHNQHSPVNNDFLSNLVWGNKNNITSPSNLTPVKYQKYSDDDSDESMTENKQPSGRRATRSMTKVI
jgi:ribosome-associated translation inhibitor RaiA